MKLNELIEDAKAEIESEDREEAIGLIKERLREITMAEKVLGELKKRFSTLLGKDTSDVV